MGPLARSRNSAPKQEALVRKRRLFATNPPPGCHRVRLTTVSYYRRPPRSIGTKASARRSCIGVTNRDSKRVRSVERLRRIFQLQQKTNHFLNLLLLSAAVAYKG